MSQFDSSQHNNFQPKSFFPITITFTIYNGQIGNGKINVKILKILVLLNRKYQLKIVKYQDYTWSERLRTEWTILLWKQLYLIDLNRKFEREKLDWIKVIKHGLLSEVIGFIFHGFQMENLREKIGLDK
eukprot:182858_1